MTVFTFRYGSWVGTNRYKKIIVPSTTSQGSYNHSYKKKIFDSKLDMNKTVKIIEQRTELVFFKKKKKTPQRTELVLWQSWSTFHDQAYMNEMFSCWTVDFNPIHQSSGYCIRTFYYKLVVEFSCCVIPQTSFSWECMSLGSDAALRKALWKMVQIRKRAEWQKCRAAGWTMATASPNSAST